MTSTLGPSGSLILHKNSWSVLSEKLTDTPIHRHTPAISLLSALHHKPPAPVLQMCTEHTSWGVKSSNMNIISADAGLQGPWVVDFAIPPTTASLHADKQARLSAKAEGSQYYARHHPLCLQLSCMIAIKNTSLFYLSVFCSLSLPEDTKLTEM